MFRNSKIALSVALHHVNTRDYRQIDKEHLSMRSISAGLHAALAVFLCSCDQGQPVSGVDPQVGRGCFERHRASLSPGAQYEGMDRLVENRLTIRVMNGVDIVKVACTLSPNGELQSEAE